MAIPITLNVFRERPLWVRPASAWVLLLVLVAGGCGQDRRPTEDTQPAMSDTATTSAGAASPPIAAEDRVVDDDPPAPRGVDLPTPTTAASSADVTSTAPEAPILRAVRIGRHAQHDRLVFEFDGEGMPAWRVEYVDGPVTDCGAGNVVPVAGDARLQVRFSGANAHTPAGKPTSGAARRKVDQPVLLELVRICDFEAEVTWVAGVAKLTPYTPRVLTNPSRLVIDIAH